MYGNSTRQLPRITNYAEAHAYFEGRPKPPRSTRWAEHQRPLKGTRDAHYRIERGADGSYYDLVNYATPLARFHKPDADGNEQREYLWHRSNVSRDFMRYVARVDAFNYTTATDGREVCMVISGKKLGHSGFSCSAWFTPSGKLIVEKSEHTPVYRRVSNAVDKLARATAKKLFDPLLTLAALRMPAFAEEVNFDPHVAGAFRGALVPWQHRDMLRDLHGVLLVQGVPHTQHTDTFMSMAQRVFDKLASDKAEAKGLLRYVNFTRFAPSDLAYSNIDPIDEKTFINALWRKLQAELLLDSTSGFEEYPQFPERGQIVLSNCTTANR